MIEILHLKGIDIVQDIQNTFQDYSGFMVFLSHIGDPRFAFTIYFPVTYFIHHSVGKRVLWAAVISEWLNAVAKWLLHGERPYWWVHESGLYKKEEIPNLQQFNITCETGPGSPSGHAMITSAVWYILISDFLHYKQINSIFVRLICWICYLSLMCAICVSRLFIATHFPHQVVAGILVGILLAQFLNSLSTSSLTLRHHATVAAGLTVSAALTYLLVSGLGFDPLWSVVVAQRWCAYKEWVLLDTTLFFSLVRDISSLLGLGIGVWLYPQPAKGTDSTGRKLCQALLALAVTMTTDKLKPAHDNPLVFYALGFLKYSLTTCFVSGGIPAIFRVIM